MVGSEGVINVRKARPTGKRSTTTQRVVPGRALGVKCRDRPNQRRGCEQISSSSGNGMRSVHKYGCTGYKKGSDSRVSRRERPNTTVGVPTAAPAKAFNSKLQGLLQGFAEGLFQIYAIALPQILANVASQRISHLSQTTVHRTSTANLLYHCVFILTTATQKE